MLNAIGWLLKTTLFATLILVLGQVVRWDGRSVSDRVKTALAVAEPVSTKMLGRAKDVANGLIEDARVGAGASKDSVHVSAASPQEKNHPREKGKASPARTQLDVSDSERRKLRALIDQMNE